MCRHVNYLYLRPDFIIPKGASIPVLSIVILGAAEELNSRTSSFYEHVLPELTRFHLTFNSLRSQFPWPYGTDDSHAHLCIRSAPLHSALFFHGRISIASTPILMKLYRHYASYTLSTAVNPYSRVGLLSKSPKELRHIGWTVIQGTAYCVEIRDWE